MSAFTVLVYAGPGHSPSAVLHTLKTLRTLLAPFYIVATLSPEQLRSEPWASKCALLVMPGGRDMPYHDVLAGQGNARIRAFVEAGGAYLGICAGGYYGASEVRFMLDDPTYAVHAKRELAFWPGACEGLVFPGFRYQSEEGSRPVRLAVDLPALAQVPGTLDERAQAHLKPTTEFIYYNGGGRFELPASGLPDGAHVVARYAEAEGAPAAAVLTTVGKGKALLIGAHPEYSLLDEPLLASIARHLGGEDRLPAHEVLEEAERGRLELVRVLLRAVDVRLPDPEVINRELLNRPTRPLPQLLVGHPARPDAVPAVLRALEPHFDAPSSDDPRDARVLKDANDTFTYHPAASLTPSVPAFLASQRNTPLSADEEESLKLVPKHVVVCPPGADGLAQLTEERWTPLWDLKLYWAALDEAREKEGAKGQAPREGEGWRYGDVLFYSEAVSSTQTMIVENSLLVMSLPPPIISLATYQLAGRGRTSNQWLNPAGCLQASTFLSLPTHMAQKVVFVQYLHALAICQALDPKPEGAERDVGPLGMRIKWPNDIYAVVRKMGEDGTVKEEKLKMGGILVNSNYSRGAFRITSGAGVNILNALPTTALVTLTEAYNATLPADSPLRRPVPTLERALAAVTARFEAMWRVFLEAEGGGFEPFIRDYEDRWLHSDQLVHLAQTNPPTPVRIQTITLDHGLLRCVPVGQASAYGGGEYDGFRTAARGYAGGGGPEYIDLQPDGNSFDIMSGMLRRKI